MNSSEISSSRAGQTEAARETQLPGRAIGVVGALIALFLAGCGPDPHPPNMPLQEVSAVSQPGSRFAVSRVGIFEDGNAYSGKRGVHEPSARCSCGLHNVLSLTRAIANGNAALFIEPAAGVQEVDRG